MTTRQYAQKSIFVLEAIFERSCNNSSELEELLNELTFRNTAKAESKKDKQKTQPKSNGQRNSVGYVQTFVGPQHRPKGRMSIEAHVEVGRLLNQHYPDCPPLRLLLKNGCCSQIAAELGLRSRRNA